MKASIGKITKKSWKKTWKILTEYFCDGESIIVIEDRNSNDVAENYDCAIEVSVEGVVPGWLIDAIERHKKFKKYEWFDIIVEDFEEIRIHTTIENLQMLPKFSLLIKITDNKYKLEVDTEDVKLFKEILYGNNDISVQWDLNVPREGFEFLDAIEKKGGPDLIDEDLYAEAVVLSYLDNGIDCLKERIN